MSNEERPKSAMFQATSLMLDAMRDLKEKKISPQEGATIAMLGKGVCDMAKEVCNFVKATGFIPVDSAFGSDLREIEPKVSREALQEQQARLEAQGMKYIPSKRERADF